MKGRLLRSSASSASNKKTNPHRVVKEMSQTGRLTESTESELRRKLTIFFSVSYNGRFLRSSASSASNKKLLQ